LLLERRYHGHHRFDKARPFGLCVLELPLRQHLDQHEHQQHPTAGDDSYADAQCNRGGLGFA
jgi:hypothetical protein